MATATTTSRTSTNNNGSNRKKNKMIFGYFTILVTVGFTLHSFRMAEKAIVPSLQQGVGSTTPNSRMATMMENEFTVKTSTPAAVKQRQLQEEEDDDDDEPATNATVPATTTAVDRYEKDTICNGCRVAKAGTRGQGTCHDRILFAQQQKNKIKQQRNMTSYEHHAKTVATNAQYSHSCQRCDPSSCTESDKLYWNLQEIAPKPEYSVTHHLQSIPAQDRIPVSALSNLSSYFANPSNVYPQKSLPLMEFNPSIIQLPKTSNNNLVGVKDSHPDAVYLACYRVSTMHACLSISDRYKMLGQQWSGQKNHDYLGMALLDKDLMIVEETVVQTKHKDNKPFKKVQDPRLFNLHDKIYLGSYQYLQEIFISIGNHNTTTATHPVDEDPSKPLFTLNPLVGSSTTSRNMMIISTRKNSEICTQQPDVHNGGKNLQYFIDANNNTVLETMPLVGNKEILDTTKPCKVLKKKDIEKGSNNVVIPRNSSIPRRSFGTLDELDLSRSPNYRKTGITPYTGERGSACCVQIQQPTPPPSTTTTTDDDIGNNSNKTLLLGISHSKTKWKFKKSKGPAGGELGANHYLSSFYAMENEPPYRVVARSGRFCLGNADDDMDMGNNPYVPISKTHRLYVLREYENCPAIHFVSGMVEKVDDPSKFIIAYGVNDCVPRMIVVDKEYVSKMLFSPGELM